MMLFFAVKNAFSFIGSHFIHDLFISVLLRKVFPTLLSFFLNFSFVDIITGFMLIR